VCEMPARNLKIEAIETIPVQLPVKYKLTVATGTYNTLTPVLVKITLNDGTVGYGEVQSSDSYDRIGVEPWRAVVQIIDETLRDALVGQNPFNIEQIWTIMDRAVQGHLWVKSGLDLALYDVLGRHLNVPVYDLLGGAVRHEFPVEGIGYGIPMDTPQDVAKMAADAVADGFVELELKVGDEDAALDIERVRLTREAIGDRATIKVDFNKGSDAKTAIRVIKAMEPFGIEWVEQPVDAWDLDGLRRVREAIDTPLIVDEAVNTAHDMLQVVRLGAADAVHIKPTIKGGLTGARRIATIAEAAGLFIIPGTLVPSGVGASASQTFLASWRTIHRGMHGSPLDLLAEDIVKNPFPARSHHIRVSDRPGMGFELDEAQVERFRIHAGAGAA
jgi:L-Ala-D/L-Glu epimerase